MSYARKITLTLQTDPEIKISAEMEFEDNIYLYQTIDIGREIILNQLGKSSALTNCKISSEPTSL